MQQYSEMDQKTAAQVQKIVGPQYYSEALIDMVAYSSDASDHRQRPAAAVWPQNTEQVVALLTLAQEHCIPITARGAGTGLAGAAVPARGGLILDMARMNRILELRLLDRQVEVESGVVYADLEKALKPHGFFFPPDPASSKVCTLGGNVSTNAGGIRGAKYGVTRDYVLALEAVLPGGQVINTGSRCLKTSSGYDLTRLLVGSEGTLAVVTKITLRISPRPLASCTAMAWYEALTDAGRAVSAVTQSGVLPSVLEIMDHNTLKLLREHGGVELPDGQACLLIETDGFCQAEAEGQMQKALAVMKDSGAVKIETSDSPEQAAELWRIRKSISSLAASLRPNAVSEDVTVPLTKVPLLLEQVSQLVSQLDLPFVIFGHAGDGNLHPKVMYDSGDPRQRQAVKKAMDGIFRITIELGGTLSGEHGIGMAKAPYMGLEHSQGEMELMRGIKRLFDPKGILNPGKLGL